MNKFDLEPLPLAITMGDASGIGPEIIARAFGDRPQAMNAFVVGSAAVMRRAVELTQTPCTVHEIPDPLQYRPRPGEIAVLETAGFTRLPRFGAINPESGKAAYDAIVAAISLAQSGQVAGLVTAPLNKAALAEAGIGYPGHTEILAAYADGARVAMMLVNREIRVVLVTIHLALREAIARADFNAQRSAIALAYKGCRELGIAAPRIAVAGLNPHAGEDGLFGDEEERIIGPAIASARTEGIDASGPWPGDTVFMRARMGEFDVVVAQYHDQGLIPVKYLGLDDGVNITLGLPFIRTSPDCGTAFDIAGTGKASPASLLNAIDTARTIAAARSK